jgi:hypothetical protein
MLTAPFYNGTKIGAVIYGLAAGIATLLGIVFVCVVVGILLAWFSDSTGWIKLGGYKPWLPLIFGEYSIPPGMIVGSVVGWRTWKAGLVPRER